MRDVRALAEITKAVCQLRGDHTVIHRLADAERKSHAHQIASLSTLRVLWFVAVQLARLVCALALLYGGERFLASEVDLTEYTPILPPFIGFFHEFIFELAWMLLPSLL